MGIRYLNQYLKKCNSIKTIDIKELANKTIVIDASIYLYKYLGENALLEKLYLMISIFRHYHIIPVFIFDGKPPIEKKELLIQRRLEKIKAEENYLAILQNPNPTKEEILEMELLKKQCLRIQNTDIQLVKDLFDAYGVEYYTAYGEADELCVYFVNTDKAWACLSEDMDMFVYGCKRVLRQINLFHHTVIFYDIEKILEELKMTMSSFRKRTILSGTDYNPNQNQHLEIYMKMNDIDIDKISNMDIYPMFDISNNLGKFDDFKDFHFLLKPIHKNKIKEIMKEVGFIFI